MLLQSHYPRPDVYAYITHQLCHLHTLRCSLLHLVSLLTLVAVYVDCCCSVHVCVSVRHVHQSARITSALHREPLITQEAQFAGTYPG